MICLRCKCEEATEFFHPTGGRLVGEGYCVRCYEHLVKSIDVRDPMMYRTLSRGYRGKWMKKEAKA